VASLSTATAGSGETDGLPSRQQGLLIDEVVKDDNQNEVEIEQFG
jgi:hypothetical protein